MKKAISYMACSMAAMLALSACGSAASSASTVASSSDAASTESTAASEASNEPVTITFAQYSGSGDNEQYLQQMVDNYMKENPNVTIDLQTYGYDDYFTQMTAKVSGGQAPDVFELDYQNFVSYAKKGALMPLDDILTKDGIDTSIYNDMALKAFSADGVQYGVPDSFSNVVLIYNKDLFDQAGIDYPTDDWKWEDAMAAAEKIRALGDNIFGYYHPISFNEFYKTVKQNGGSLFNDDFTEFTMDTPENIETLQYMVDMQQKTNVMPTEEQMAGMGDWDLFGQLETLQERSKIHDSPNIRAIATSIGISLLNLVTLRRLRTSSPTVTSFPKILRLLMKPLSSSPTFPPTVKQRRFAWTQAGSCLRFRTRISSLSTKKRLLRQIARRSLRALITL